MKKNTKKLYSVLNKDLDFGVALNAVGHMCLGLGNRTQFNNNFHVETFFSDSATIRSIRQYCIKNENIIFSDFINTMTVDTADDQIAKTKITKEKDLIYYGASLIADDENIKDINDKFGKNILTINSYNGLFSTNTEDTGESESNILSNEKIKKFSFKASLIIDKTLPTGDLLTRVTQSNW